ncbi:sensor histidine kinase [Sphingomonas sp. HF-S4]|uniref:histidine kinase n=1 Tax=Sphingomonas agrestis TaxID=3080540 RepID=A0ABU3Y977_9SPHN|nr:sensor histidine kinase [Sphingomonas sp. HF-S4]MDV3457718.1 sensor histidine kinase [Sphingomonas sp. HF-S4]
MARLGELDLPDRLAPWLPRWVTSVAVGLLATACAAVVRFIVDTLVPGAAIFSWVFPAAMIATLFARWLAGLTAASVSIGFGWYYLYPVKNSFRFETSAQAVTMGSVILTALITILLAELFRRSVRRAAHERDRQIAERELFLEEFDHRVKNNFTLVTALLDMQRRRAGEGETADALSSALTRVESIARAHRHLYRGTATPGTVDMAAYLQELCAALSDALFLRGAIVLEHRSDHAALPRDRAVSIGLIVNELVTNAAKHAFTGREGGAIAVRFAAHAPGWRLTIADNGTGMTAETRAKGRPGGLGQRLIDGFVRQARGTMQVESGAEGTTVTVDLEA